MVKSFWVLNDWQVQVIHCEVVANHFSISIGDVLVGLYAMPIQLARMYYGPVFPWSRFLLRKWLPELRCRYAMRPVAVKKWWLIGKLRAPLRVIIPATAVLTGYQKNWLSGFERGRMGFGKRTHLVGLHLLWRLPQTCRRRCWLDDFGPWFCSMMWGAVLLVACLMIVALIDVVGSVACTSMRRGQWNTLKTHPSSRRSQQSSEQTAFRALCLIRLDG